MRRTVGAQEKFMAAADGGPMKQPLAMGFPLQHGEAVVMRSDASLEKRVAIEQQVVRGDGGGQSGAVRRARIPRLPVS